jgi:hypothetical protein
LEIRDKSENDGIPPCNYHYTGVIDGLMMLDSCGMVIAYNKYNPGSTELSLNRKSAGY